MAQLRLDYPRFKSQHAEILQVTHSNLTEAQLYFRYGRLAFPYLCDPDRVVHERYGVHRENHAPTTGLRNLLASTAAAAADLIGHGEAPVSPLPYFKRHGSTILDDSPQAIFLVDREGVIRSLYTTGPNGAIPPGAELLRDLSLLR